MHAGLGGPVYPTHPDASQPREVAVWQEVSQITSNVKPGDTHLRFEERN